MPWCGFYKVFFILIAASSCIHGRQNSELSWRYTPGSSTFIGSSGSDIESSCSGFTNCTCQYSNTSGMSVNCSSSGFNTTRACSICFKINDVTSLDLSRNSLYRIPESCFRPCGKLRTLSLSYCNVQTIETGTFSCLRELTYLDLSYNMALGFITLRNVSNDLQFTKIEVLKYSKVYKTFGEPTWINKCDICFLENTTLKELHLNRNRISGFQLDALAYLPSSLETLYLEYNMFNIGPYIIQVGCLDRLKRLEVSVQGTIGRFQDYNDEVSIHEKKVSVTDECKLPPFPKKTNCKTYEDKKLRLVDATFPEHLEVLNIRSSGLMFDPLPLLGPFNTTNNLRSIDVSDNLMFNFTGYFLVLDKLENVNMSDNFCSYMSEKFSSSFRNIKTLDAVNNKLGHQLNGDTEGITFKIFEKLTTLRLRNNLIDVLSENAFIYSTNLEILDLSLNGLNSINFRFDHMRNLSKLYLQENKLSTLPVDLLEHMTKYSNNISIDLSNNSLALSCGNLELLKWMKGHSQYFVNVDLYLFLNDSGKATMFKDINTDLLGRSCRHYTAIIVVSVIFILTCISITIFGLVYRYRWRLRYMYYMIKAKHNGYIQIPDSDQDRQYQYDVFISYANENYQFVTGEMFQKLEEAGLSLCLHQKDFLPGSYIAENILEAIKKSKKTLVVLTNEFLQSKWCMYEFNMARMESIYSRGDENIIFVVKFGGFDITRASLELRECLESESYLAYPKNENERPYFWQMLVASLEREQLL